MSPPLIDDYFAAAAAALILMLRRLSYKMPRAPIFDYFRRFRHCFFSLPLFTLISLFTLLRCYFQIRY